MAGITIKNTYEVLGDRAPIPCDISDAHGIAMAALEPGTTLIPLAFRHPALLPDEVRIRVTHCGMCHSDCNTTELKWSNSGEFPCVPDHEIVGVVEKRGSNVTDFRIGERVGVGVFRDCCKVCADCDFCREGYDNSCPQKLLTYSPHFGGYATSFQASTKWMYHLPEEFPGLSAPLFCAGATVFEPLKLYTSPGKRVGVMGIGGLGHLGIQFASKMGLDVVAISTSDSKKDEARAFGATGFVNMNNEAEWNSIKGSLDHILVTTQTYSVRKTFELLRNRGSLSLIGLPEKGFNADLHVGKLVYSNLSIHGNAVASRAHVREMVDFATLHNIRPMTEEYPFAEAQRGFNSLAHGTPHFPRYRAVIETESFFQSFTPAE